jgi:hypothetical protein
MAEWWRDDQALAYAILEQGRVCCARLRNVPDTRDLARVATAQEALGIAAYVASDHLLDGVRAALHVLIDEMGPVRLPGPDGPEQAVLWTIHAARAVERCAEAPWLAAQMDPAHQAVQLAYGRLTGVLGSRVTAALAAETARAGRLERAWQARHLRPPRLSDRRAAVAA